MQVKRFIQLLTNYKITGNIENDKKTIPLIIKSVMGSHQINVSAMNVFDKYYYNSQEIVTKVSTRETSINYKISYNEPYVAVNYMTPYCVAIPPKFILRKGDQNTIGEELKEFNDLLDDDFYPSNTLETMQNACLYRVGYQAILKTNELDRQRGRFFETVILNPKNTFVVYDNSIRKKPILGVTYFRKDEIDSNNRPTSVIQYNVWTRYHQWEFIENTANGEFRNNLFDIPYLPNIGVHSQEYNNSNKIVAYPLRIGSNGLPMEQELPIVEYMCKNDGTNVFEPALPLIDMMSTLVSLSLDAANENLDYILLFRDIDFGTWEKILDESGNVVGEENETFETIKKTLRDKMLSIKGIPNSNQQPDVDVLKIPFSHSEVQILINFLSKKIKEILFLPSYDISSGGQATGAGADSINGSRATYNMAGTILSSFIKSEGKSLDIKLDILKSFTESGISELKPTNIEIKPMLNKDENLITQTQAFSTMINAGSNRVTAYIATGLVPDATETAKLDELEEEKKFQTELKHQEKMKQMEIKNPINQNSEAQEVVIE